jgi:hypothetical protein
MDKQWRSTRDGAVISVLLVTALALGLGWRADHFSLTKRVQRAELEAKNAKQSAWSMQLRYKKLEADLSSMARPSTTDNSK